MQISSHNHYSTDKDLLIIVALTPKYPHTFSQVKNFSLLEKQRRTSYNSDT